ncbi:MAG TPA: single-stranded-DNA-specific exonuclease RecJ [Geothermobacteraceae bacterium]|nr:single-stranded-DNA-specific exonuclease RecJ [Geothermobacteraceae bacterium]
MLCQDFGLSRELASVLVARGFDDPERTAQFLTDGLRQLPDPFLLKGMSRAVLRLEQALQSDELIIIHGDYDVDGITACTLLVTVLRQLGGRVDFHIPLRMEEGYGLSSQALEAAQAAGAAVVVSVDCGVTALEEAELARSLGLDLIITDHHQPKSSLPAALAILNPHQPGCEFPGRNLSGVGVAFFLAAGLRKQLRESGYFDSRPEPDLRQQLDLVALGTVADLVPLHGVNRILVRSGLAMLQNTLRVGLQALKQVAAVKQVDCGSVGFRLAPRLNAAGRLDDARLAVELLLTEDLAFARQTAAELDQVNLQRQQLEQQILDQAVARVEASGPLAERFSLVLADAAWHQGVIGIVASRLVERFYRPVVLIALDGELGKGSARSISGFHLFQGLQQCSATLTAFGGHEYAAGLALPAGQLEAFSSAFEAAAHSQLGSAELTRSRFYDRELLLEDISEPLACELELLNPCGAGNPEPVFLATGLCAQQVRRVGTHHLRLQCRQGGYSFPAIAFGMAERIEQFSAPFDILFSLSFNEWQGRRVLQLRIRDVRPAG